MLQLQYDESARVVVITGEGRAFCAGDDVSGGYMKDEEWQRARTSKVSRSRTDGLGSYGSLRAISQALNRAIRDLDKSPSRRSGLAIQSRIPPALACDFRIAARTARLGSATLRFGYLPDEAAITCWCAISAWPGRWTFPMRKRIVDAAQALELGLVHEVVEPENLMASAMQMAAEFAHGPQVAMRLLKRAIYSAADLTFDQAGDDIATKTGISDHHADTKEGLRAWREKRPPRFNGD